MELEKQVTEAKKENNLTLQTKCSDQAQKFFDYFESDPESKKRDEFINHYNAKLDKCFIVIKQYPKDISGFYGEYLYDAIEKKPYGSYGQNSTEEGKKYWEIKPFTCEMLDKFCETKDEFHNFTKQYIEN